MYCTSVKTKGRVVSCPSEITIPHREIPPRIDNRAVEPKVVHVISVVGAAKYPVAPAPP